MPLPDKWDGEETIELDPHLKAQYDFCIAEAQNWAERANEIKSAMMKLADDAGATAFAIDGRKVYSFRPTERIAEASLRRDYPELTQHYVKKKVEDVFDSAAFAQAHPDIVEKYRVKAFKGL